MVKTITTPAAPCQHRDVRHSGTQGGNLIQVTRGQENNEKVKHKKKTPAH